MKRRDFLISASALTLLPGLAQAAALDYAPGVLDEALSKGKAVLLDFKASWCSTCATQERVLNALKAENPAYEAGIIFINVDWDAYGNSELAKMLKIPRRSTLVAIGPNRQEIGRIVAGTGRKEIKALLDAALAA